MISSSVITSSKLSFLFAAGEGKNSSRWALLNILGYGLVSCARTDEFNRYFWPSSSFDSLLNSSHFIYPRKSSKSRQFFSPIITSICCLSRLFFSSGVFVSVPQCSSNFFSRNSFISLLCSVCFVAKPDLETVVAGSGNRNLSIIFGCTDSKKLFISAASSSFSFSSIVFPADFQ